MSRFMAPLTIAVLAVALRGCPLELSGSVGIASGGSIDKSLVGRWEWVGAKSEEMCKLLVLPFNSSEYFVEMHEISGASGPVQADHLTRYRAFATQVGNKLFLNVRELSLNADNQPWFLATYSFPNPNELDIRFVGKDDVPEEIRKSPETLIRWLPEHLDDPHLYADQEKGVFRRIDAAKKNG